MIKSFLEHFSSFCVNESLMMKVKGKSAPGKKGAGPVTRKYVRVPPHACAHVSAALGQIG
jgi:hypothetical protein